MKENIENKSKPNLLKTIINKTKIKMQKTTKKEKVTKKECEKIKAPFKILICITFASNGEKILEILNKKNIKMSSVVKGYGTAESSMMQLLGIKETERDIVLGLVKSEKCKNLINDIVTEFDNAKLKGTFCALLSPSSASMEMINLINFIGEKNND